MSLPFIIPPQYIPTLARQQTGFPSAPPPYLLGAKQVAILAAVQPVGLHPNLLNMFHDGRPLISQKFVQLEGAGHLRPNAEAIAAREDLDPIPDFREPSTGDVTGKADQLGSTEE